MKKSRARSEDGAEGEEEERVVDVSSNQRKPAGGTGRAEGSEPSTTKQPFSSLAASLRGASQAYLSSRLLNRLTSGSHPSHTHTRSHTLPSLIPSDPEESRPRCSAR